MVAKQRHNDTQKVWGVFTDQTSKLNAKMRREVDSINDNSNDETRKK